MSSVIYLKFLSTGKFVLIEFLNLNYIFAYFWFAIWLSYQLFIHACSKANFRENYYFCKFVYCFQLFCVIHPNRLGLQSGCMRSCRLPVWQVDHPDALVSRLDEFLTGFYWSLCFLFHTHTSAFLLFYHVLLCVFLADFSQDFGILCTSFLIPWYLMCLPLFF
jgi:hypothetical protein